MKIALFSHLVDSPGNTLMLNEARKRGHQLDLIRPDSRHLVIGEPTDWEHDLLYTRIGSSAPVAALANLLLLEKSGVKCINSSTGLLKSRDKTVSYCHLANAGVPVPRTIVLGKAEVEQAVTGFPGPPWILKLPLGTKGQGVCLIESKRSLRSTLDTLQSLDQPVLLQEFIEDAQGADIRVLVLGGKARLAARRTSSKKGEFRSNVHLGGRAERVELTPDIAAIAERATRAMDLQIAGVDLLESQNRYLVIEVNGSPGLTADPELPSLVMNFLEEAST